MSVVTLPPWLGSRTAPHTIFDVGVASGTPWLYDAFPNAYFVLVEPVRENIPRMQAILRGVTGTYVLAAAGSRHGTASINIEPERRGMTSLLERTDMTASGSQLEPRDVPVVTLDSIARGQGVRPPFGLKIDTEGFELEVIRGAREVLMKTDFVIAETSTTGERFVSGYAADDLINELRMNGFVVADVLRTTRRFADLLFLRATPRRWPSVRLTKRQAG
jgi:FkbM family methyltransferase